MYGVSRLRSSGAIRHVLEDRHKDNDEHKPRGHFPMSFTKRIRSKAMITVYAILGLMVMVGVGYAQGDRAACDQAITACIDGGGNIDMCEREHILCRAGWSSPVNPTTVEHDSCEALNTICQEVAAADPEAFSVESCQI